MSDSAPFFAGNSCRPEAGWNQKLKTKQARDLACALLSTPWLSAVRFQMFLPGRPKQPEPKPAKRAPGKPKAKPEPAELEQGKPRAGSQKPGRPKPAEPEQEPKPAEQEPAEPEQGKQPR